MKKKNAYLQLTPEEEEGITKIQARVRLSAHLLLGYISEHVENASYQIQHQLDNNRKSNTSLRAPTNLLCY
jgi:hypothetical protein